MRRRVMVALVLLTALLAAAHLAYWYWPRERAAVPDPASAAVGLLAAGMYDVCLWVPYPHQNLAALAGAVGDLPQALAAAMRLAGSAAPEEMRTFGPFLVPPARELVACADLGGGRLRIAARVYPGLALVAKLAGRLAGNAWLAGGEVGRLRVEWRDGLWMVSGEGKLGARRGEGSGDGGAGSGTERAGSNGSVVQSDGAPALALVRLARAVPDLPAGTYVLRRAGADLDLDLAPPAASATAGSATGPSAAADRSAPGEGTAATATDSGRAATADLGPGARPALLIASRATAGGGGEAQPPAALALFTGTGTRWNGGASRDLRAELPGIALFHPAGRPARWGMPGGALGRLVNGALPRQEAAGWSVVALDEDSLRQAVALAPRLAALMPPAPAAPVQPSRSATPGTVAPKDGVAPRGGVAPSAGAAPPVEPGTGPALLTLGVWIEPLPALAVVSRVRRFLASFPFAPRQQVRRWRDWETALQPLGSCGRATLVASASAAPSFHLRLQGCGAQ